MIERCAIIGAGISGLSAAYFLEKKAPCVSIDIYDANERAGGVIRTEHQSGCIVEGGPDSFLTAKKAAFRLCQAIGLESELVGSNDSSRKTFLFHEGELKELPEGFFLMVPTKLRAFLASDLFTWQGKLEALSDLFSYPEESDCTVSDFITRRFGKEVSERIAEPMIGGIYGADVQRLSMQSALPQIWELQKKGSMILQLLGRQFAPPRESLFTTLQGGMESLTQKLQAHISANWNLGQSIDRIGRAGKGWTVEDRFYDAVILAGSKLPNLEMAGYTELNTIWKTLRRNSAIVVAMAFAGIRKDGFGWLVPAQERRSVLACTYVSNKFPHRSPPGIFLVRAFIGGAQAAKWIERPDNEIEGEVRNELKRIAAIDSVPVFCRIFRWTNAMPEYHIGHRIKMEAIHNLLRLNNGIHITGNIFVGVGVPDCIQHAENTVDDLIREH